MTTPATTSTMIETLVKFVNQRPGLEFANYGDVSAYRSESRGITQDKSDFFELLGFANRVVPNLNETLIAYLENNSGRLTIENGKLSYCTGQYFPTEYRPAASRVLVSIIWNELRKVYNTGELIRKAARRNVSRRVANTYFR